MTRIRFNGYTLGSALSAPHTGTPRLHGMIASPAFVASGPKRFLHRPVSTVLVRGVELVCGKPEHFALADLATEALRPALEAGGDRFWVESVAGGEQDGDAGGVEGHKAGSEAACVEAAMFEYLSEVGIAEGTEVAGGCLYRCY